MKHIKIIEYGIINQLSNLVNRTKTYLEDPHILHTESEKVELKNCLDTYQKALKILEGN